METVIKLSKLETSFEKLKTVFSDLEKLTSIEPSEIIQDKSRKNELPINLREVNVIQKYDKEVYYIVEFWNSGNKKISLGSQNYTPKI